MVVERKARKAVKAPVAFLLVESSSTVAQLPREDWGTEQDGQVLIDDSFEMGGLGPTQ